MKHPDTELLIRYAEQRLTALQIQAVQAHTGRCSWCAAELQEWERVFAQLRVSLLRNAPGPAIQSCMAIFRVEKTAVPVDPKPPGDPADGEIQH